MWEIRLHGRGGQGVAMAAEILATAFVIEGKFASSFPMFGVERRGAPVTAYVRFHDRPIRERTRIYHPDCLLIMDSALRNSSATYIGLKRGGTVILNSTEVPGAGLIPEPGLVAVVDATRISLEEIGRPITNSCVLGAFAGATKLLSLDSLLQALAAYFQHEVLERNRRSARRGYEEVRVITPKGEVRSHAV